ncbi:MAG: septation protein A [Proteobacteria bacterium]|nr:septation protein A [Pseudomonadota bacterium]HQR02663.1 septation protein A [Rhodocyclaceae bacterium]
MKFLFDLFPVILFFIAFKFSGIYTATAVAIATTAAQIGWVKWRHGKIDTMLWISMALITFFGGATLLLRDEAFIKWKPTVLYWLFAGLLLGGRILFGKNLMRPLLEAQLSLPEPVWRKLNTAWILFFVFMGIANLLVAFYFFRDDTDAWVDFKLFGGMGFTFVFVIAQGFALSKYLQIEENS